MRQLTEALARPCFKTPYIPWKGGGYVVHSSSPRFNALPWHARQVDPGRITQEEWDTMRYGVFDGSNFCYYVPERRALRESTVDDLLLLSGVVRSDEIPSTSLTGEGRYVYGSTTLAFAVLVTPFVWAGLALALTLCRAVSRGRR